MTDNEKFEDYIYDLTVKCSMEALKDDYKKPHSPTIIISKEDGNEYFSTTIKLEPSDIDGLFRERFWRRMLKRFFPIRYEVKKKMTAYMYRDLINRTDKFLAWGDDIG